MTSEHSQIADAIPRLPVNTVEELAALLADIKSHESTLKLGSRALQVFSKMLENPHQAAISSIADLADSYDVNPSTLTRLAKTLGFSGFSAFQKVFKDYASHTGDFYSQRANELFREESEHQSLNLAARIANDENANIATMLANINPDTLDAAVDAIQQAPRIRAHGLRQSYPIADYLSYGLGLIRQNVSVLSVAEHGIVHGIAQLSKGDLLFAIASKPYTQNTVSAAKLAKQQGITVIAITDTYSSPLTECAEFVFIAPTTGTFFSNNMGSSLVLIEVLLSLTAQNLGEGALQSLRHYEQLISSMDVEVK